MQRFLTRCSSGRRPKAIAHGTRVEITQARRRERGPDSPMKPSCGRRWSSPMLYAVSGEVPVGAVLVHEGM